jgi:hypothetical protein
MRFMSGPCDLRQVERQQGSAERTARHTQKSAPRIFIAEHGRTPQKCLSGLENRGPALR